MRNHIQPSTRTALFRKVSAGVGLTTALVVMWALPASASTVKIGPQATQGSIKIKPGDWIRLDMCFVFLACIQLRLSASATPSSSSLSAAASAELPPQRSLSF